MSVQIIVNTIRDSSDTMIWGANGILTSSCLELVTVTNSVKFTNLVNLTNLVKIIVPVSNKLACNLRVFSCEKLFGIWWNTELIAIVWISIFFRVIFSEMKSKFDIFISGYKNGYKQNGPKKNFNEALSSKFYNMILSK